MGKVISVANQKGRRGKTTTCVNLGTALAQAGRKVCPDRFRSAGQPYSEFGISKSG